MERSWKIEKFKCVTGARRQLLLPVELSLSQNQNFYTIAWNSLDKGMCAIRQFTERGESTGT